jgi:t-SNARE complex subunit (syntaxin)
MSTADRIREIHGEHEAQDAALLRSGGQLDKVQHIGLAIGDELGAQSKMLTTLDGEVDHATNKVNGATGSIAKLLKNKNSKLMYIVAALVIVAIILLIVVLVI